MIYDAGRQFECTPLKDNFRGKIRIVLAPGGNICINGKKLDMDISSADPRAKLKILKRIAIWFCSRNHAGMAGKATKQCVKVQRYILAMLRTSKIARARQLMAE